MLASIPGQNSDQGRTLKKIAEKAGVSHDTIFKVEKIEGKAPEETKQKIRKGELTINKAHNYIKRQEIKERAKAKIDQLMRVKYGSAKPDERTDLTCSEDEQVWTMDKTAELLNQSKALISEDLQLAKDLDEDPELAKIKRKSFAKRTVKQKKKRYEIDQIPKEELKGKYNVILVDSPWDYDTKATALRGRAFLWIECQLG